MSAVGQQYFTTLSRGQSQQAFTLNDQIREDFWLTEIHVTMFAPEGEFGQTWDPTSFVNFGLKVGRKECAGGTQNASTVPIPVAAKRMQFGLAANRKANIIIGMDQPVYVPKDQRIQGVLAYDADGPRFGSAADAQAYPSTILAWITTLGIRVKPGETPPDKLRLPWFVGWRSPASAVGAGVNYQYRSPDQQLSNSNPEDLRVQRMLGVMATGAYCGEFIPNANVRIQDSSDKYIVQDKTPMAELFSAYSRDWDMGCLLHRREYLNVEVQFNTSALVLGSWTESSGGFSNYNEDDAVQAIFGLVGYRDVPYGEVYVAPPPPMPAAHPAEIKGQQKGLPVHVGPQPPVRGRR